jgi:hypothetical protein
MSSMRATTVKSSATVAIPLGVAATMDACGETTPTGFAAAVGVGPGNRENDEYRGKAERHTAAELDEALGVARDLHAGCCQPLRSPRMERLQTTLTRARDGVVGLGRSPIRPPYRRRRCSTRVL